MIHFSLLGMVRTSGIVRRDRHRVIVMTSTAGDLGVPRDMRFRRVNSARIGAGIIGRGRTGMFLAIGRTCTATNDLGGTRERRATAMTVQTACGEGDTVLRLRDRLEMDIDSIATSLLGDGVVRWWRMARSSRRKKRTTLWSMA